MKEQFKVGDVKVVRINSNMNGVKVGDVKVVSADGVGGCIKLEGSGDFIFQQAYFKLAEVEPAYLTRRAELIEAIELVEQYCDVYYSGDHAPIAAEVAADVYPEPRPKTLPACKIRVRYTNSNRGSIVERLVNVGPHRYMLNSAMNGNRLNDKVLTLPFTPGGIGLDALEELLDSDCSIIDTWSPDTEFPELLECC